MILTHFVSRINFTDEHHCSNLWLTRSKKKKSTWSNKKENFDFVHSAFPFCSTSEYHSSSESSYTDVRLRLTHLSLGLSTTPIWTPANSSDATNRCSRRQRSVTYLLYVSHSSRKTCTHSLVAERVIKEGAKSFYEVASRLLVSVTRIPWSQCRVL